MEQIYGDALADTFEEDRIYDLRDLDPLMKRIGDAHHVFLGEASHGTHEYYTWRAAITKELIVEKGFNFLAVEGDWPDCYRINRYIKGYDHQEKTAFELLKSFDRWPTWMWANWETVSLVEWLKNHNRNLPVEKKAGFYGLDVYSLWDSMKAILSYLMKHDPRAAEYAKNALQCFEPYGADEQRYARAQYSMENSCRQPVLELLMEIRKKAPIYNQDPEAALDMEQNAEIAFNAEKYYRNMININANTWNLRDKHMMDTLNRILEFHGPEAKSIVWAHNTHIGDARFTDMAETGDINIGQLAREQKGEKEVVLIGFGSFSGTVIAGSSWNAKMKRMTMPPARRGSVEELLHEESPEDKLLIFDREKALEQNKLTIPHRAIGVVYHPEQEKSGNYVPSVMNSRYDAFIYVDKTNALYPLHLRPDGHKVPETFPFEV